MEWPVRGVSPGPGGRFWPEAPPGFAGIQQVPVPQGPNRIGEAILTDSLVADGISEFVFIVTPQIALGATGGNTPPVGLAQP